MNGKVAHFGTQQPQLVRRLLRRFFDSVID
jgi:hypothetical protein